MEKDLDYTALADYLEQQQAWFHPAEMHGLLTVFAALRRPANEALPLLFGKENSELASTLCHLMWQRIHEGLNAEALQYALILPEEPLAARAEALLFWIEGFQLALQHCQHQSDAEQQDLFQHLQALRQLDCAIADSEENRQLLNMLEEHARLCVFSLLH